MLERPTRTPRSRAAFAALLGLAILASAGVAQAAPPAPGEPRAAPTSTSALAGRWVFAEREAIIHITVGPDARGQGRIVASPRAEERGAWVLRDLRYDASTRVWVGALVMPDAGEAAASLRLLDTQHLEVEATRWVFTKTMAWTREAAR